MEVSGKYTFKAPIEKVWAIMLNTEALKAAIPGIDKFEETTPDTYDVTLKVGAGPVKGIYGGQISVLDKSEPGHFKLHVEGNNATGFVKGDGIFDLTAKGKPDKPETELNYTGKADVGGQLAGIGTRMLIPVAKMMIGQFFKGMEKRIDSFDTSSVEATSST